MARIRALSAIGGGAGGSEWLTPTNVSGTTWTAGWGFDADTVVLMYTHSNGYKYIMVIPTDSPSGAYFAAGSSTWATINASPYVSFADKKHISINFSATISNVSVCPIVGKPNGYFV